jgi:hypothetical protein
MTEEPEVNYNPRIHTLVDGSILNLNQKMFELTASSSSTFSSIYISIGSKMNERTVQFSSNSSNKKPTKYRTNCLNQMVPVFLQTQPLSQRSLCIIIDQFNNEENLDQNIRLLKTITDVDMDICLINKYCNKLFLEELISYIVEFAKEQAIDPNKMMICNFVKYLGSPNTQELACEGMIPEIIQKTLNNSIYSECFYEWFGYRFYLYNFIYNYKKYGQYSFIYRDAIKDLELSIKKRCEDPFMVSVIQDTVSNMIWDNVFDLCTPYYEYDTNVKLATSLKSYLLESGQLKVIMT